MKGMLTSQQRKRQPSSISSMVEMPEMEVHRALAAADVKGPWRSRVEWTEAARRRGRKVSRRYASPHGEIDNSAKCVDRRNFCGSLRLVPEQHDFKADALED